MILGCNDGISKVFIIWSIETYFFCYLILSIYFHYYIVHIFLNSCLFLVTIFQLQFVSIFPSHLWDFILIFIIITGNEWPTNNFYGIFLTITAYYLKFTLWCSLFVCHRLHFLYSLAKPYLYTASNGFFLFSFRTTCSLSSSFVRLWIDMLM